MFRSIKYYNIYGCKFSCIIETFFYGIHIIYYEVKSVLQHNWWRNCLNWDKAGISKLFEIHWEKKLIEFLDIE